VEGGVISKIDKLPTRITILVVITQLLIVKNPFCQGRKKSILAQQLTNNNTKRDIFKVGFFTL
jgi:hypothetical protein